MKFPQTDEEFAAAYDRLQNKKKCLRIAADILKQCSKSQSLDLPEFSDQREKGWSARWSRLCKLIQVGESVGIQHRQLLQEDKSTISIE
jgi:ribosomal protein L11 methylase PrmA